MSPTLSLGLASSTISLADVSDHQQDGNMIVGMANVNKRYDERLRQRQHTSGTGTTSATDISPGVSCLEQVIRMSLEQAAYTCRESLPV